MKNFLLMFLMLLSVFGWSQTVVDTFQVEGKAIPTATFISSDVSICAGQSTDLWVELTEGPTWTLEYSDGTTTYVVYPTSSPFLITVSPAFSTTYTLLSVSNSACSGDIIYGPPPSSGVVDVTVNPLPVFNVINIEDALCYGSANGSAEVDVLSGTAPYTYYWDNSWATPINPYLTAGSHSVTVTDANGCQQTNNFTIAEPAELIVNYSVTNVHCGGGDNGSISTYVGGGTAPYTYSWSNGATTANITDLTAGNYSLTVTDANSCIVSTGTIVVGTDPGIVSTILPGDVEHVTCFGGSNGSAMVTPGGGATPYTFLWSNMQTSQTASGLSAGSYTVTTTDANGCTHTTSITITEPTEVTAMFDSTNVSCDGLVLGTASVTPSGGTMPYTYTWSHTSANVSTVTDLTVNGYWVTVEDDNGCIATGYPHYFYIDQDPQPTVVVTSGSTVSCGGDPVDLTATPSGGDSFTYLWSTGQTGSTITVTPAVPTTYYVTVTNNFGCDVVESIYVDVIELPVLDFYPDPNVCEGTFYVNLADSVSLSFGSVSSVWFDGPGCDVYGMLNVSVLTPGVTYEYFAHYTEAGCTVSDSATITLQELPTVDFEWAGGHLCDDGVPVNLVGGTPLGGVYSGIGVSGGIFDPVAAGSGDHIITYTYTNAYGCSDVATDTIFVDYPIPITIVADATWCTEGGIMDVSVSPVGGYMTANGSYLPSNATGDIFYFDPSTAGTYSLVYTIPTGCTASETESVEVYDTPDATLTFPVGVDVNNLQDTLDYTMTFPMGAVVTIDGIVISGNIFSGSIWGAGPHEIICTTNNGYCVGEYVLNVIVQSTIGIETIDYSSLITVYPNPATTFLNVDVETVDMSEIQIYSTIGQMVYQQKISGQEHLQIDVGNLPPAVYYLNFITNDNEVYPFKFIKQ